MSYDPDKHHRRSIRLKRYDYASVGAYFVTLNVQNRLQLFGRIAHGKMQLSRRGEIAASCWEQIPSHFAGVELDAYVIMPDHMHGLLWIVCPSPIIQPEAFGKPVAHSLPTIIRSYKSAVTREINLQQPLPNSKKIWQRNYYEDIPRDQGHIENIRAYIRNNPLKWMIKRKLSVAGADED